MPKQVYEPATKADVRKAFTLLKELRKLFPGWPIWDQHIDVLNDDLLSLEWRLEREDGYGKRHSPGRRYYESREHTQEEFTQLYIACFRAAYEDSKPKLPTKKDVAHRMNYDERTVRRYMQEYHLRFPPKEFRRPD